MDFIDKRIQRSKQALKDSFLNLLKTKTFNEITISEIAKQANYNRGTFYANFNSKENLLDEIVDDVLAEMVKQIRKPYKTLEKVDLRHLNVTDITLFQYFQKNASLYKLLLSNQINLDFRYRMALAIEELFIKEYEYVIEEGIGLDPKWLYIFRAHGISGLLIRWIEEDCSEPPEYMAKQIVSLMIVSTEIFYVKDRQDHVLKK